MIPESISEPDFDPRTLLEESSFPHPVSRLELRETYLSWIVLTGPYAYKIKKPRRLPFVDASSLDRRRELCEQEVILNRRLAAVLYLDAVAITRRGTQHRIGGNGRIVEYAVRMKQFDPSQELEALLAAGMVIEGELVELAETLAAFHLRAPVAPPEGAGGYPERFRRDALGNLATLLAHVQSTEGLGDLGTLIDWTHDGLHELAPVLREREIAGFLRECHGDLHARNIVRWERRLIAFDCLEFNPALRWIDVMNDTAFLYMDLAAHERTDLAHRFLDRYLELTGDFDGIRLLRFYAVYRALVRAMVDAVSSGSDAASDRGYSDRLRRRLRTAQRLIDAPKPTLVLMHGRSGSGKSWLSERLVAPLAAVRIRSDIERRRSTPFDDYSPAARRRNYELIALHAEQCLLGGVTTIVDATFLRRDDRRLFESLAVRLRVPYQILDCRADVDTLRRRIESRRSVLAGASDADSVVLDRQLALPDDWGEDELPHVLAVQTRDSGVVKSVLEQCQ